MAHRNGIAFKRAQNREQALFFYSVLGETEGTLAFCHRKGILYKDGFCGRGGFRAAAPFFLAILENFSR